jgi:spore coat protein U-like protein
VKIKMSYSVVSKCGSCKKSAGCLDSTFIYGAVCGIHSVNTYDVATNSTINRGHKGAGTIKIECNNFEEKLQEG